MFNLMLNEFRLHASRYLNSANCLLCTRLAEYCIIEMPNTPEEDIFEAVIKVQNHLIKHRCINS